jgi:glycerol dehydrogenase-like iron-containing ADH family enzyme
VRAHQRKARTLAPEAFQGPPAPVFFGPCRWIAGDGAWEAAAAELKYWPAPLGLVGEAGLLRRFRRGLTQAWLEEGLELRLLDLEDGADCCGEVLAGLVQKAGKEGVKSLIGLGGGRALDLAKLAADAMGLPLATAPTSAATCACATAVAVRNDGKGGFVDVADLGAPPKLCLVETSVLRAAPRRLLAAGLADCYAKWLEWSAVESAPSGFGSAAAWDLARRGAELCAAAGAEALADPASAAFERVLEACLLWSSAASCLGAAPAAAAHSLAKALSLQEPGKALLHGEAVGLGLLWQESLLARAGRATMGVDAMTRLFESWALPTRLPSGLDLERLTRDALAADESVHLLGLDPAAMASSIRGPSFRGD